MNQLGTRLLPTSVDKVPALLWSCSSAPQERSRGDSFVISGMVSAPFFLLILCFDRAVILRSLILRSQSHRHQKSKCSFGGPGVAGHRHHPANCALQLLRRGGAHGPKCLNRPPAWKLPRVGVYGHLCKLSDGSSVPLCVFFPLGSELRRESDDSFEATAEKARPTQDLHRGHRSLDRQGNCS